MSATNRVSYLYAPDETNLLRDCQTSQILSSRHKRFTSDQFKNTYAFRTKRDTFAICLHIYLPALLPMSPCIGLSFLWRDSLPQVPQCVFPFLVRNLGQLFVVSQLCTRASFPLTELHSVEFAGISPSSRRGAFGVQIRW